MAIPANYSSQVPASSGPVNMAPQAAPQAASVVPFIRGTGLGRYNFFDQSGVTLSASGSQYTIPVKAYDYMRSIIVRVDTTAAGTGTAVTLQPDGPFNFFTNVQVYQPNGQTLYQTTSGYHSFAAHKYVGAAGYNDPRQFNDFNYSAGGGTAPTLTFQFRIPFTISSDGLGAVPNKNAAAPFFLQLNTNALASVFGGTVSVSPTFRIRCYLEAYDQPPTSLGGLQVQTTPPNMNTLMRITEQQILMSSGQFDAKLPRVGNYIKNLLFISRNSSGARIAGTAGWADPVQIVLDEDPKDNVPYYSWLQDIYEYYGYGAQYGTATAGTFVVPAADSPGGIDAGVYPYVYNPSPTGEVNALDTGNRWLPTIESESYLLRGNWGASVSKLNVIYTEVLPVGNVWE